MLRKILFLSVVSTLAIGINSFTFVQGQQNPKKKAKKEGKSETAAHKGGIVWYNMTEGYAKAKKEKKVLVVDVFTSWCYWCKVMDKQTYENPNVVGKMNKYAVAVKFNPEVNGQHQVNGQTLTSDQLAVYLNKGSRIPGYPHTFIWKDLENPEKVDSYSGYLDTTSFNTYLNKMIQQ